MTPTVHLTRTQIDEATNILSAAFRQDPVLGYFLPEAESAKLDALKQFSQAMLRYSQPYHHLYTTVETVKGIAGWLPPEASLLSKLWQAVASGFLALPFSMRSDRIVEAITFLIRELTTHQQITEPHWYLAVLGVAPQYQGQGIGGALLQPILQQADRDQIPCYLETSTESAVRFYQRHGFEVARIKTVAGALKYWTMQRSPRQGLIVA